MSVSLDRCSSCRAVIFWAVSERGRPIPMNLLPDQAAGNMALSWLDDGQLQARVLDKDAAGVYGGPLYVTHFMTCPWAGHHRSNRKREPQ